MRSSAYASTGICDMAHDALPSPHTARLKAMPIVIVGHVDHGKSTLVGRLLHDTGSLPDDKMAQVRALSAKRGLDLEWSFLLDALQIERDQGITVDTTQVWFSTPTRRYVIIDAPGHKEFLRNMLSGAASAEAAVLVVDASIGVSEQTRRHAYILELLGLRQVIVAVNKMDLVGRDEGRYQAVATEIREYLAGLNIEPAAIVPISARHGDNVVGPSAGMPWYGGPSLVAALDGAEPRQLPVGRPLRLPVQDVYRLDDKRFIVGRIESGSLSVGDALRFAPHGAIARVASIETWNMPGAKQHAATGESVALTLDEEIFVERGHLASAPDTSPIETQVLSARLIWLDREPLIVGRRLTLRLNSARYDVVVEAIERAIDVQGLLSTAAERVEQNGVAIVRLRSRARMAVDTFDTDPRTGRGVAVDGHRVLAGCVVEKALAVQANIVGVQTSVDTVERAQTHGHRGGVLWLTGLSGAGKSTLAMGLLRRLFDRGRQVYALDGDNLRQGLNSDLGFSAGDRSENIRRAAEVARLFADAGFIVVVALISPLQADRQRARRIVGPAFREVYVRADISTCRQRDPKHLYARADAGEVAEFTGVSAPYEAPSAADVTVDTTDQDIDQSIDALEAFVESAFVSRLEARRLAG